MRTWILAAMTALLIPLAFACGGDDKTIKTPDGDVTVSDDLPDDFPDDFPIYDGADLQGAIRGEQDGQEGLVATWTTGDDFDDVKAFYDDEFGDGAWKSQGKGTIADGAFWTVANEDNDKGAYLNISESDGDVTIVAVISDDAASIPGDGDDDEATPDDGSDDEATPDDGDSSSGDADLPDEVDLPDEYPSDKVPVPSGARVTNASTLSSGGTTIYTVIMYSEDSIEELADYYQNELEGNGFTQSLESSQADGAFANYAESDDGTGLNVNITVAPGDVDGYNIVSLTVASQ